MIGIEKAASVMFTIPNREDSLAFSDSPSQMSAVSGTTIGTLAELSMLAESTNEHLGGV
jgi:hypothetical protein